MNSENRESTRRYWICGGGLLLTGIIVAFLFQLFGPNPRIVVSKETTVITQPLGDDGLPDYQRYWRDLGREGVTHENNGAVLFWQAIWPGELSQEDRLPMSEILGFEKEPDSSNTFLPPYAREVRDDLMLWSAGSGQQSPGNEESPPLTSREHPNFSAANQAAEEVIDRAMSRPWTSEQVPPLADWVARNEKPLSLLVEASQRPKWWSPSPSLLQAPYSGGIAVLLPAIQITRDLARAFNLRAMWHVGEGHPQEAWNDLKVNFRLARVTGEGQTLVGQLVAIAIDGITLHQTIVLLQQEKLDAVLARRILSDLNALGKPCDIVRSFDESERTIFADMVVLMARDPSQIAGLDYNGTYSHLANLANFGIDWNHILREGNRWHDRLVEAARKPTREERIAAFEEFDEALVRVSSANRNPIRLAASFLNSNARSALIADVMVSLLLPALGAAMNAEDRAVATLDLTRTAAALAVYRAEQGEYPETLDQLVPGVVAEVPLDLYTDKPFHYERMPDGGYLLYSMFENGTDDGGTDVAREIVNGEWVAEESEEYDYEKTDLVIRVPMPKFEMPREPVFVE